jgi:hypothetical protein
MADQPRTDPDTQPSGGPNRANRTPFSIAQAQRELREAERTLKQYGQEKVKGQLLDDAKDAVREARKTLESLTSGSRDDRRDARSEFMGEYYNELGGPWIAELVKRDDELRGLFEKAIRTDDVDGFLDDLYQSKWWKDPKKSGSWKSAFQMEFAKDTTAWTDSLEEAKRTIRKLADDIYDMVIPEEIIAQMARRYMYQGWSKNENEGLRTWLSSQFSKQADAGTEGFKPGGMYTETYNTLRDAARNYGIDRDAGWLDKTTRDVLNPNSGYSADDAWNELIAEAETIYPVFAGKLSKDRSVRDLGAGYINQLYRRLELGSPDEVDLMDPLLRKAFTTPNEKGEPSLMPLWQFEQEIKKDGRWQYTTNALSTYSQIGSDLARMMGFVG